MKFIVAMTLVVCGFTQTANADQLEDAYTSGYSAGYSEGYRAGAGSNFLSTGGQSILQNKLIIPGTNFNTAIDGDSVAVAPGSSVAIIPDAALLPMQQKLGVDFMKDNKVILNNGILP